MFPMDFCSSYPEICALKMYFWFLDKSYMQCIWVKIKHLQFKICLSNIPFTNCQNHLNSSQMYSFYFVN